MIRRDAHTKSKVLGVLTAHGHDIDNETSAIDITEYMCVEIVVVLDGNATAFTSTNKATLTATHSADGTTFADIPQDDLLGGKSGTTTAGLLKSFEAAHATTTAYRWGYRGDASHLKVKMSFANGYTTNRTMTIMVIGMDPWDIPTADQN